MSANYLYCPHCGGRMAFQTFYEDYCWTGKVNLREGLTVYHWVEWAAYVCIDCGKPEVRIHRYLSDDSNPEVSK